jgi:hypothetical protein
MVSINITSTNYNGKTAQITFYSVNDPDTPVNLGSHTIPYTRTDVDVYGIYELTFPAYSKTCTVNLVATTTTTTTTTAAPGVVTGFTMSGTAWNASNGFNLCIAGNYDGVSYYVQADGPTRVMFREGSSWYVAANTDPGTSYFGGPPDAVANSSSSTPPLTGWSNGGVLVSVNTCSDTSFTLSGSGTVAVNGCYLHVGMYNGKPYYSNGTYFIWYEGYEFAWFINQTVGSGAPLYMGSDQNNVPSSWYEATGSSPAPTLSQGCGGATTTTTTTAAPTLSGYNIGSITRGDDDYAGNYTISGTSPGNIFPSWQHATKNYILAYQGGGNGWLLFPGTIEGDSSDSPIAFQSCGFPGGGNGTCTDDIITGTYATNDGMGTLFTVTDLATPTTTTATPTTTTTTTEAPTTTTTTAAPGGNGLSISGSMGEDGTFCPVATYNAKPFYKHTSLMWFIWYDGVDWYYGDKVGGTYDPANPTSIVGDLRWLAYALSSSSTAPLTGWGNDLENATITTQMSCPITEYTVSDATHEPAVNGIYSIAGSINGTPYYVKTLGGTFYLHRSIDSLSGDYPEWNITSWLPCEGGTRDCFSSAPSYYTLIAPSAPPVSGWFNPGNGEDITMIVIKTN